MSDGVTLWRGDCLEYMRTMPDGCVDAVITDPPYGISYQSARRIDRADRFAVIHGDDALAFEWARECERIARDPAALFAFCRWDVQQAFFEGIAKDWRIKSQVVWDRGVHGLGDLNGQYAPCHDVAWFAVKGKWTFPNGRPRSVYRVDRLPANELQHPTQKPLPLMKVIINDLTQPGATVFDPFMGSGTTGVACMQTGRKFIGCEIDAAYFAIAEKRIREAQMQPRLVDDGPEHVTQQRMIDDLERGE